MGEKEGYYDIWCCWSVLWCGGLTYGLEKAGLIVTAGYDLDATCEYAYNHNNNARFINKNIEEVDGKEIKKLY